MINGIINVALPKGRLGEKVCAMLDKAGYGTPSASSDSRKLIFENEEKGVRYFWVKPSDVAIYVCRGAADVGICGKDVLAEYEPDVYELLDLHVGVCRMAVAAPSGYKDDMSRIVRVATKYTSISEKYYKEQGRQADLIRLNGSIELAPLLGLSDVIVDIVETGTTLRENDLHVIDTVMEISARFIANKSSYKFKYGRINEMKEKLAEQTETPE